MNGPMMHMIKKFFKKKIVFLKLSLEAGSFRKLRRPRSYFLTFGIIQNIREGTNNPFVNAKKKKDYVPKT